MNDLSYKIMCIYHGRFQPVKYQLTQINNFAKSVGIKVEVIIIVDHNDNSVISDKIRTLITEFQFCDSAKVNYIFHKNNLGGPFAISSAINNFILNCSCKFLIIEDDIKFTTDDITEFFNAVDYWATRGIKIVCTYPFWQSKYHRSRFPVFWFWGGESDGLPVIDLRMRKCSSATRYLLTVFERNWFAIIFWWLIYMRQKYVRWYHWDYALLFSIWNEKSEIGWTPIRSVKNEGFNSTGTNTSRHNINSLENEQDISDLKLFYCYLGFRDKNTFFRYIFLLKVFVRTILKIFKAR